MTVIKHISLSGNYSENGHYIGKNIRKAFPHILKTLKHLGPYHQDTKEITEILGTYCPQLLEEFKGFQTGLHLSEKQTMQLFSGYDMPKFKGMGCTSFITSDYYVRNYDFSPAIYDYLFVQRSNEDHMQIYGNSQFVVGYLDGMNDEGLVVGLHFVNNEPYEKGFLSSMIVRIVLEMCSDVEEAIQMLQSIPHAASYNYSLLDRKGDFAVVEASPFKSEVLRSDHSLSCVNMFKNPSMKKLNRRNIQSSTNRLHDISNYATVSDQVHDLHDWFSTPASPLFYTDYEDFFGTLHTVSYLPKDGEILLTPAAGKLTTLKM